MEPRDPTAAIGVGLQPLVLRDSFLVARPEVVAEAVVQLPHLTCHPHVRCNIATRAKNTTDLGFKSGLAQPIFASQDKREHSHEHMHP